MSNNKTSMPKTRRQFLKNLAGLGVLALFSAPERVLADSYKYVCPMHPQIVRDHEGTCPICGMDLVKQKVEEATAEAPAVSVPTVQGQSGEGLQQTLAIQTAKVTRDTLWKYIRTYGVVKVDETQVVHVHPYASGWVSSLTVREDGAEVKKGQLLYRIYSPEIVSAQQDLLLAMQNVKQLGKRAQPLLDSARTRLELLGLDDKTIRLIERRKKVINKVPVYAPQSGVVGQLNIQPGMYVQPSLELMSITDLSQVWVEAQVLPYQQSWIAPGKITEVSLPQNPQVSQESAIDYLYPEVNAKTKTLRARMTLQNAEQSFPLGTPVDVIIYGGPKRNILVVPLSAIIDDGSEKRVVKALPNGRYQPVQVETGMQSGDYVEIVYGLQEGDEIVISGQFLLDSESQIKANLRRLSQPKSSPQSTEFDPKNP